MKRWLLVFLAACGGELAPTPEKAITAQKLDASDAAAPILSDACWVTKTCAAGFEYECAIPGTPILRDGGALDTTPTSSPPTEPGFASHCGAPACVRSKNWDVACPRSQAKSFACPHDGNDGSVVGAPDARCTFHARVGPAGVLFCCP
jgi:hypothetical protein